MTSGARYHRVTTYPVISLSACLARPKSRICSQNQEEGVKGPRGVDGPACRQVRGYARCHPHQLPPQSTSAHQLLGHCLDDWSLCLGLGQSSSQGVASRWGGGEGAPNPAPSTHLQLTVLVHRQIAGLQVLWAGQRTGGPARQQGAQGQEPGGGQAQEQKPL